MKGKILLRLLLAAVIVVTLVGPIGPVQAPHFDSTALPSARPCVSDSDCPGGQICCPINGLCTNLRGCRKDPL